MSQQYNDIGKLVLWNILHRPTIQRISAKTNCYTGTQA